MGWRSWSAKGVNVALQSWSTIPECRRTLLGWCFRRSFHDSGSGVRIRVASVGVRIEIQVAEIVHEMFYVYAERILCEVTTTKAGRMTKARGELISRELVKFIFHCRKKSDEQKGPWTIFEGSTKRTRMG